MKIKVLITLATLFYSIGLVSQSSDILKADKYFDAENYNSAVQLYEKIQANGKLTYYIAHQIADCYRLLKQPEKSVIWYYRAISFPKVNFNTYFLLSYELKKINRIEESDKYLKKYNDLSKQTQLNEQPRKRSVKKTLVKQDSLKFNIVDVNINSDNSDIAPSIQGDHMVFMSSRSGSSRDYYDLFQSEILDDKTLTKPEKVDKNLLSKLNDGPVSFNKYGNVALVTRNVEDRKLKRVFLNVFVHYKKAEDWEKSSFELLTRLEGSSYMHAFLAYDDSKLFIVSDKPGGYGGFDIYMCSYKNGFLGTMINLGPEINTPQNEIFPFVNSKGVLFYSSNKKGGKGGLDVYYAIPEEESYKRSFNIGYPINTKSDDFCFVYSEEDHYGYFCSNREGGRGDDDIYGFEQIEELRYTYYSGKVSAKIDNRPVSNALIDLTLDNDTIVSTKTDVLGNFSFFVQDSPENVIINVNKWNYHFYTADLDSLIAPKTENTTLNIILEEN